MPRISANSPMNSSDVSSWLESNTSLSVKPHYSKGVLIICRAYEVFLFEAHLV